MSIASVLDELAKSGAINWSGGSGTIAGLGTASPELRQLVARHDGLLAFDKTLRCFGASAGVLPSLAEWNRLDGWRAEYQAMTDGLFLFAEDAMGNQFALDDSGVARFLAETGGREPVSSSVEGWLARIAADPDDELGAWLLREWAALNGPLRPDKHVCPKMPFFAGGKHEVNNLHVLDRYESMAFKGSIATQIRDLPQGAKIKFVIKD